MDENDLQINRYEITSLLRKYAIDKQLGPIIFDELTNKLLQLTEEVWSDGYDCGYHE